jgi:hypothetical protein
VARTADVEDPSFRDGLSRAEQALDDGEYSAAVRHAADVFGSLIAQHPEVIVLPPDFSKLGLTARPPLGARRGPWPSHFGVQLAIEDQPKLIFKKEQFTLTEAAAYVEYTLEAVLLA